MEEKLRVLSLFDGMSCGQIALKEAGIDVSEYLASEIDKYAIAQTQLNFPDTKQLGSVVDVVVEDLGWIDLLIGGSPCQSFSFAGKRKGMATKCAVEITSLEQYLGLKADGFEFEGQSYLFWEYMRILVGLRKVNPDIRFLLENVEMGSKWEMVLSKAIGIRGIHINSSLVSAQNRKRIYWTNIKTRREGIFGEEVVDIPHPDDMKILLRDVLEDEVEEKYYLSDKILKGIENSKSVFKERFKPHDENTQKSNCITARIHKQGKTDPYICVAQRGRDGVQQIEPASGGKTNCLTSVQKDNLVMTLNKRQQNNFKDGDEKANTFLSTSWKGSQANGMTLVRQSSIRRLTPTECARLQTVPDWYIWNCSATQQYRMLGNGWTISVIKHIFQYLNK